MGSEERREKKALDLGPFKCIGAAARLCFKEEARD